MIVGKVWKPKEEEKVQINEDDKVETEWDEVLAQATEEELVDLAGMSGIFAPRCATALHRRICRERGLWPRLCIGCVCDAQRHCSWE